MVDLVVTPGNDRQRRITGHGANRLIHAVVVGGSGQRLVGVICRTVRRLEDGVDRQPGGGATRDEVANPVARTGQVHPGALPLLRRDVVVIDDRPVLHVAEAAIDRDAQLDVLRTGHIVIGHEDVGEAEAVERGIGRHPHPVVAGDLLREDVGRPEAVATVIGFPRGDIGQRQARVREHVIGRRGRDGRRRLLRPDRPIAVTAAGGVVRLADVGGGRPVMGQPPGLAAGRDAGWPDHERVPETVRPDARLGRAAAALEQEAGIEHRRRLGRRPAHRRERQRAEDGHDNDADDSAVQRARHFSSYFARKL